MNDSTNIELQRYQDGIPSVLRRKTVYTELFFYRKSDVLVQLTKVFCERFLPKYGDRTVDQMVQAARSIKQNIAEGLTDGQTSFEVELKLLGIAKGSNQELLEDFQDYLKHHKLCDWGKAVKEASTPSTPSNPSTPITPSTPSTPSTASLSSNSSISSISSISSPSSPSTTPSISSNSSISTILLRYNKLLAYCRTHNNLQDYEPYFSRWAAEEMCNTAICLCHMVDKAITSFIEKRDKEFVEEGGIRERMTAARLDQRGTQKQIIAQLENENAALRAQVASLQQRLQGNGKE